MSSTRWQSSARAGRPSGAGGDRSAAHAILGAPRRRACLAEAARAPGGAAKAGGQRGPTTGMSASEPCGAVRARRPENAEQLRRVPRRSACAGASASSASRIRECRKPAHCRGVFPNGGAGSGADVPVPAGPRAARPPKRRGSRTRREGGQAAGSSLGRGGVAPWSPLACRENFARRRRVPARSVGLAPNPSAGAPGPDSVGGAEPGNPTPLAPFSQHLRSGQARRALAGPPRPDRSSPSEAAHESETPRRRAGGAARCAWRWPRRRRPGARPRARSAPPCGDRATRQSAARHPSGAGCGATSRAASASGLAGGRRGGTHVRPALARRFARCHCRTPGAGVGLGTDRFAPRAPARPDPRRPAAPDGERTRRAGAATPAGGGGTADGKAPPSTAAPAGGTRTGGTSPHGRTCRGRASPGSTPAGGASASAAGGRCTTTAC